mmetsp:Transcript_19856/g.46431  ORF Transcript_19856/g.46431 Transcript_19856/m.46431 type:complete len:310 (+) Transcript_19856:402-1331(+)
MIERLEGALRSSLESLRRGVHLVGSPILENTAHVDQRASNQKPLLRGAAEALLDGRDVAGRNVVAYKLIHEGDAILVVLLVFRRDRLEVTNHLPVLTTTAGLPLVEVVVGDLAGDGLTIVHLGLSRLQRLHLELAAHALAIDLEVKLAHARDDGLVRILLHLHSEGGVFALKAAERLLEARLIFPAGSHRQRHHCVRHKHGAARYLCLAVREGHPGLALDASQCDDVTGQGLVDIFHLVGMHPHQTFHGQPFVVHHVDNRISFGDLSLVHPHVGHLTCHGVVLDLEGIAHERILGTGRQRHDLFFVIGV